VNAKQHINIKELLKKWDSDYTLQQVKVEQFLFYFWFLSVSSFTCHTAGFGQVG
jgi:hypothetical protein